MPIAENFPEGLKPIGKISHSDGENFHWVWGPGKTKNTDAINATFAGTGSSVKEERKDFTDKADPIREHDCIWCMACVSVCPPQAIKVDQSNLEAHEKAAGTYVKIVAGTANPHAHD